MANTIGTRMAPVAHPPTNPNNKLGPTLLMEGQS
jgi:hypothetical protein